MFCRGIATTFKYPVQDNRPVGKLSLTNVVLTYLAICEALCTVFCRGMAATLLRLFPSCPR